MFFRKAAESDNARSLSDVTRILESIEHGDPNQGEGFVVHIAHVGSARKNLAWARDLGRID